MAETVQYANFDEFRDAQLLTAAPGTIAFHGALHPREYPSDRRARRIHLESGQPMSTLVPQTYLDMVGKTRGAGVVLQRLMLVHDPRENLPAGMLLNDAREFLAPVVAAGEEIRVATYLPVVRALMRQCGLESPAVVEYLGAVSSDNPKGSFWSLREPNESGGHTLAAVWPMRYENGHIQPTPLQERPFTNETAPLLEFENFFYGVFNDPNLAQPLYE